MRILPPVGARGIATFTGSGVEGAVRSTAARHRYASDDLAILERSPRTYDFTRSRGNSFTALDRRINLRDLGHEAVAHEMHHAAQHESHIQRHGVDAAETVATMPAHMMAMERSALATGMMVARRESSASSLTRRDLSQRWPQYEQRYRTTQGEAASALGGRFHGYSRDRLREGGISPPSGGTRARSGSSSSFGAIAATVAVGAAVVYGLSALLGGGKGK
jgi:hypothetical protein